ncbi:LptF/LptG family permease [Sulfurimonas lithotrophica]|uniref:LptF/LptG family permease n=1 Tax=Sulfurimonas lithotrophica TaxID=2590022 RepID=A0A5P8NZ41_9BACT|nr:LptF/LptG family permease [Sulfurimonas lithotrophica]QFR48691.1 LptF/LptG family permease [Sulfurimonas lithotrophica]
MLAFKYISYHFLKYFFIILFALVLFSVAFEYTSKSVNTLESANLLLIFLVYKSFFAIDMLLPISLIFAMISTKILLIRSNALVSFYSLGYSRVQILKPFVVVSVIITIIYILLHISSSFSRANEHAKNIEDNSEYLSPTRDLFFSYKEKFVYFSKMIPLQSRAEGIRVFTATKGSLKEVVVAKNAVYEDGFWHIKKADIIVKPDDLSFNSPGIKVSTTEDLKILEGFKPKILDQVYEGKVNFTIGDAIEALLILKDENVNIDTIKGSLYKIIIHPFFAPFLVIIIFFFVPISARFLNVSLFSFGAIIATLMIWGIMFTLSEFAKNKTIPSEIGIVLPVFILFIISVKQWRKYAK